MTRSWVPVCAQPRKLWPARTPAACAKLADIAGLALDGSASKESFLAIACCGAIALMARLITVDAKVRCAPAHRLYPL